MSEISGILRPRQGARSEHRLPSLRPVSRVSFNLTDKDAFDRAAQLAVRWLAEKVGGQLPDEAQELRGFDTRGEAGLHPCHVVRIDDHRGSVWAARIDEPGSHPDAGDVWSTEIFVERGSGRLVRFGAQLTTRRADPHEPLMLTRPRVVHDVLSELSAEEDDETLIDNVTKATATDAGWLAELINLPSRRLPVVVTATDDDWHGRIDLRQLANRLSGAAHLVALDNEGTWELTRLIGKRMSTFNGAIRIYMPGVTDDDDPFRHPLMFSSTVGSSKRLLDLLANRIFPLGFRDREGDSHFWRLAQLRQVSSEARAQKKTGSDVEKLVRTLAARDDEIAELKERLEDAQALERLAIDGEADALNKVEQLKAENDRLRIRIYELNHLNVGDANTQALPPDRDLQSYDDLADWADEVLGPHIVLHSRALKDARQNGHPDMLRRIESTLLTLRDHWVPWKIQGGVDRRDATKTALAELGVSDEPCFHRKDKAKEKTEYSIKDGSLTRVLYDHFKYGNSRNNAEQFRIYYAWDPDAQKLVIGKMPSHLTNDQS